MLSELSASINAIVHLCLEGLMTPANGRFACLAAVEKAFDHFSPSSVPTPSVSISSSDARLSGHCLPPTPRKGALPFSSVFRCNCCVTPVQFASSAALKQHQTKCSKKNQNKGQLPLSFEKHQKREIVNVEAEADESSENEYLSEQMNAESVDSDGGETDNGGDGKAVEECVLKRRRHSYTAKQKNTILRMYAGQEKNQREFCRLQGLSVATFNK